MRVSAWGSPFWMTAERNDGFSDECGLPHERPVYMEMDLEIGPCLPGWARRNNQRSSTIHLSIITACLVDDEDFLTIDSWKLLQRSESDYPGIGRPQSHFERNRRATTFEE